MKKNATELVFLLDRSGSMAGMEDDTIGGFNAMIEKQKKLDGECLVTTILFDNHTRMIHDRIPIKQIEPMTEKEYSVGGCTAFLDAFGGAIDHIGKIHKYIRPEDIPEHTMFVITTDGMENASRSYDVKQVRTMVRKRQSENNWEFLFLGANMDAITTAKQYGICPERAATFTNDSAGVAANYEAISEAIKTFRENAPLTAGWKRGIEKNHDRI